MPGIVVGVDGSPNSERALDWAMKEAAVRHAPLTVIAVHQAMKSYWTGNPVILSEDSAKIEETREAAEEMTQKAAGRLGDARPASVNVNTVNGFAAKELIDMSHDADLVVVGARGGGGFGRLLMGSVSDQVVHHAACPVVVVPHER
ncbi:MAG: universal stress protein [Streptosporangiaceae bacterium]